MTCNIKSGSDDLDQKIQEWMTWDKNEKTLKEIQDLVNEKSWNELRSRLMTRLSFGTAGLRGKMQAGFNGMNDLVIVQTAQGLMKCLLEKFPAKEVSDKGIVIGYDGRHNSKRFAELSAAIFLNGKIPVYLFNTTVPTPFVPFCVLEKSCIAGIMVTASHNPKEDNGYKVYWNNGAQIMSPHDKDIQKSILANLSPMESSWDLSILSSPLNKNPYDEILKSYCLKLSLNVPQSFLDINSKSNLKFVYTAMHGVGYPYIVEAFKTAQLTPVLPVVEQRDPDPEFPTVKFPNPEEGKSCLNLSIALGNKNNCSIILANDPDADRLACAEKDPNTGDWRVFTGNELGALLGWWAIQNYKELNPDKDLNDCYLLNSTVSSKILKAIARVEGCQFEETLTGFKYMGNRSIELINEGKTVLFAFEEAIGFMFSSTVLDKDGVSAAAHLATMSCYLKEKFNRNLSQQLEEIYKQYGFHCTKTSYFFCYDPHLTFKIFQRIRNINDDGKYPQAVSNGKYKITEILDVTTRKHIKFSSDITSTPKIYGVDLSPNTTPIEPTVTSSQMLIFSFENGVVITLRTSGTEPKIKYYAEMCAKPGESDFEALKATLQDVINCVCEEFLQPTQNNLKPKSD
uniref:CSON013293 protein n=1 Tax=Culicoides sonorensis TaxID=179676 RepID=A0A336KYE3_CULSO